MKTCHSSVFAFFPIIIWFGFHLSLARLAAVQRTRREAGLEGERSRVLGEDECVDGLYRHGTSTCCLCAAGQRLLKHCTSASPHNGRCEPCEPNTYRSSPNQQSTCERCTSCSHPNANLEVDMACSRASDTKCRCKAHHYCISASDQGCKLCSPCGECGTEGIKVACTATNNTVCPNKLEARSRVWAGVACAAAVLTVVVLCCWRKRKQRLSNLQTSSAPNSSKTLEMDLLSFNTVDPWRHLGDIADVLGWKTMSSVAMRNGMSPVVIEACTLDHPHDCQEQTLQLLKKWTEQQGRDAMKNLIQTLNTIKQRDKAQKVKDVLSNV
ncbi:tumor necrosis factor receptor superfamily member 6-like [Dunckerocampus dactyliophorus]|uniref:tumor necrosis factor receptor superfamily member 6-like n=1 Tax=Dunckerocampus dactyliophorus TaxID=161453 RepID=UPI0024072498|nr:tumor necrosis factor receptor superfamily member 6-like [Dunckerocampus dactyliophorus]